MYTHKSIMHIILQVQIVHCIASNAVISFCIMTFEPVG